MGPNPYVIMQHLGQIATIIQSISLIMGVALVFSGLFYLKRYGEQRTFMSQQLTLAGPVMRILAGIFLLVLPTFIGTAMLAFWSTTSPIAYHPSSGGWDQYVPVILMFVRIIGVCAIIRSIILISRSGSSGGQPGTLGKALILFMSGLLLIHIVGVYYLLQQILDIA